MSECLSKQACPGAQPPSGGFHNKKNRFDEERLFLFENMKRRWARRPDYEKMKRTCCLFYVYKITRKNGEKMEMM